MKMLRNPSDKSENRYAPLQEHKTSVKENTYEPLTLDRNVKMPADVDELDKKRGKKLLCKTFPLSLYMGCETPQLCLSLYASAKGNLYRSGEELFAASSVAVYKFSSA